MGAHSSALVSNWLTHHLKIGPWILPCMLNLHQCCILHSKSASGSIFTIFMAWVKMVDFTNKYLSWRTEIWTKSQLGCELILLSSADWRPHVYAGIPRAVSCTCLSSRPHIDMISSWWLSWSCSRHCLCSQSSDVQDSSHQSLWPLGPGNVSSSNWDVL